MLIKLQYNYRLDIAYPVIVQLQVVQCYICYSLFTGCTMLILLQYSYWLYDAYSVTIQLLVIQYLFY